MTRNHSPQSHRGHREERHKRPFPSPADGCFSLLLFLTPLCPLCLCGGFILSSQFLLLLAIPSESAVAPRPTRAQISHTPLEEALCRSVRRARSGATPRHPTAACRVSKRENYGGSPTRCTKPANLGSERRLSNRGSTLRKTSKSERSPWALSSNSNARSLSPRAALIRAIRAGVT